MVDNPQSGSSALGYMPRSKQAGFIFVDNHDNNPERLVRTMAHELSHGMFNLKHTFSEYSSLSRGATQNLMDYTTTGTELLKYQWDYVHDPQTVIPLFEGDEESALVASATAEEPSDEWEDFGISSDVEYVYCFTPAGKIFALPSAAKLNFVNNTNVPVPHGAMVSYELNSKQYFAKYEKRNEIWYFTGYYSKEGTKGYSYVSEEQLEAQIASDNLNITTASLGATLVIPLEEAVLQRWIATLGTEAAKNLKSVGRFTVLTIAASIVLELFVSTSSLEYGVGEVVLELPLPNVMVPTTWELPDGIPINLPITAPVAIPHKLPKDNGNCSVYVIFRFDKITAEIFIGKYGMTCQTNSDGTQCDDRPVSQCRFFNTSTDPFYQNMKYTYNWTWVPFARNISSGTARLVEKSLTGGYIIVNGGALPPVHERPCFKCVTDFSDIEQVTERMKRVQEWFNEMKNLYGSN